MISYPMARVGSVPRGERMSSLILVEGIDIFLIMEFPMLIYLNSKLRYSHDNCLLHICNVPILFRNLPNLYREHGFLAEAGTVALNIEL